VLDPAPPPRHNATMEKQTPHPHPENLHQKVWDACRKLPEDYEPYGQSSREDGDIWHSDCSCGCRFYLPLEGKLGFDWGVCRNPASHRCGLLTFEHQGCVHFEQEPDEQDSSDPLPAPR
jgi:hypothetical protein